ncbi:hypothetical protein DPMN_156322 [Dreissena polymorpha]|uniref:Uncharacterized protein n=1 Tax=Dreissena polymorpha TaxID=45954 RepID=A0A9D4FNU0_DREPO|nr:hypothetical protein DPMN_156322 [Dreissena polymorpha]
MDIVSYSSVYETKCLVGRVRVQNYKLGPRWTTVFKKMALNQISPKISSIQARSWNV